MAYTDVSRRDYNTGSLFQRCEKRWGCPPLEDGPADPETGKTTKVRPKHKCKARWYGVVDFGSTAEGGRRRVTVSGKSKSVVQRRLNEQVLAKREAKLARGTKRTITVAKWAEKWLEMISTDVRPGSLTTDKAAMKWVVSTIGHHKLTELEPEDIRSVAAAIRRDGGSSSTALRYHGSMVRMLKAAAQEGYTVPGNVLVTQKPKAAATDRDAMKPEQCIKVVAYLTRRDDDGNLLTPDASRWILALLQGLRQAEALGLTWATEQREYGADPARQRLIVARQVKALPYRTKGDPESGFLIPDGYDAEQLIGAQHLVPLKTKAGQRAMPLVPWATVSLLEWQQLSPPNPHGLVWPGRTVSPGVSRRGKVNKAGTWPRNAAGDREDWERIQAAAGIEHPDGRPFHVHEIRHSTASLLLALGVPEPVRVAIMGHSAYASTKTYEHVDLAPMLAALEQVSTTLGLPAAMPPMPAGDLSAAEAID